MTDNRTSEPTEAQVEAAAKAINLAGWTFEGVCEPGEYCDECRKVCVEVARAALVAAGTAPQAESADEVVCQCGHGTGSHDFSDPREPCREVLCGCRRWFGVATVLPSSTVDEEKLSESTPRRLKSCVEAWPECETGEYNPSCCRFPKSCSATLYSAEHVTEDDLEPRAVVEAIGGERRGEH